MLIVTRPDGLRIDHEDIADGYKPRTFDIINEACFAVILASITHGSGEYKIERLMSDGRILPVFTAVIYPDNTRNFPVKIPSGVRKLMQEDSHRHA
jgi:hypothetical protein